MAQIGLKNLYYSVMTIGDNGTESYGTPVKIGEAISVDINPSFDKVSLYGDDMAVATDISMKEVEVTIETTDIPLKDQAALLGHSYSESDGLTANMTDSAPYVALLFESEKHSGGIRCVKLMKGKFAPTQETINTKGESLEYQVPSLTGTFVADKSGDWKKIKDFAKGAATASWYTSV